MSTRDLNVYSYHPRPALLWAPVVVILAMAIFGFVRGLMGAADLTLEPGFGGRSQAQVVGRDPRPVLLETIPSLTPRLIGTAPPAPKAPVAVNSPAAAVQVDATNAVPAVIATVAPVVAPPEAPPAAPPIPAAPPQPPAPLQGLY